eukprot:SAG31_NODE_865_length_11376_cov_4.313377_3_plen_145_part_00
MHDHVGMCAPRPQLRACMINLQIGMRLQARPAERSARAPPARSVPALGQAVLVWLSRSLPTKWRRAFAFPRRQRWLGRCLLLADFLPDSQAAHPSTSAHGPAISLSWRYRPRPTQRGRRSGGLVMKCLRPLRACPLPRQIQRTR